MDNLDELIIDDLRLDGMTTSATTAEKSPIAHASKNSTINGNVKKSYTRFSKFNNNKTSTGPSNGHSNNTSKNFNHSKQYQNKNYQARDSHSNQPINASISKTKKAKRLPWNAEILKDRFTPQTFHVQLIDLFLNQNEIKNISENDDEEPSIPNLIVFIKSEEWKNYLSIMAIKQYAIRLNDHNTTCGNHHKLILFITDMGSEISKYVEIISRHTTLRIAGIDLNVMNGANGSVKSSSEDTSYFSNLKKDAQILIMTTNIVLDWFKKSYICLDEVFVVIFDEVNAAFHNTSYKILIDNYLTKKSNKGPNLLGFSSLDLSRTINHLQVKQHIDFLKDLFKCDQVETATDLLDTHNIFNGFEPRECIQLCDNNDLLPDNSSANRTKNEFKLKLIKKIKDAFTFLESINTAFSFPSTNLPNLNSNNSTSLCNESLTYIHLLCIRVLNECVYLLNEVGIWCLAKSLLPFICQLDKLSLYIENTNRKQQQQNEQLVSTSQGEVLTILNNPNVQQELILQYTSTCLRELREMCIKQFLMSKSKQHFCIDVNPVNNFLINFSTPKVKSLINLLRTYSTHNGKKNNADEFCCLIFVQNKQVATSLSLLLKKIAKEDGELSFIYPNYVIGPGNGNTSSSNNSTRSNSSSSQNKTDRINEALGNNESTSPNANTSDCLKQEEILRKFYSGEINLLICTYEMEEHISAPSCVNLIIRFNCNVNSNTNTNGGVNTNDTNNLSNDHLPFDYFHFIKTKSRAKSKNASCYFFIEQDYFESFFRQYVKFKQIENLLIKNYSKLIKENQKILSNNAEVMVKSQSSKRINQNDPFITLENSIFLINKYCIRLPSDALTQLTPRFKMFKHQNGQQTLYKCLLYLPINSGVREPIQGTWEETTQLAILKACHKCCLMLFLRNEFNEMLEPITKEMFYKINHQYDSDDEKEWSQFSSYFKKHCLNDSINYYEHLNQQISAYMAHRPGGSKRKQVYQKKVSPYLKSFQLVTTTTPSYLYVIKCSLTTPININESLNKEEAEINKKTWSFGLLVSKPLLEIVDFPIFTQNGEETVNIDLIKSSFFLTPNQLKLIKSFHKFLFSNVLRMEGRGAIASQFLQNQSFPTINGIKHDQSGSYVCILKENDEGDEKFSFDWDLMKSVEGCTDRTFMRIPSHVKRMNYDNIDVENDENETENDEEKPFVFEKEKYIDSVVIPYYRANDIQPQFYCVTSIDMSSSPLSPFPSSSHSNSSQYSTFYQYFAIKYNILITNVTQPLLVVSHPSTRLNLLTPRYMNMRASVLQKSYTHHNAKSDKKSSSNRIFLVPELVNIHTMTATTWRRSLCLPSILYRLNSLLLAEELRREIAHSTGVGVPWVTEGQKFDKLSFVWDTNKEIEISEVPDIEVDVASIQQQKANDQIMNDAKANSNTYEKNDLVDSKWNFEISEWDDSCLKETAANKKNSNIKSSLLLNDEHKNKLTSKIFELNNYDSSNGTSGWLDDNFQSNHKTLFIDPNDMDFFGDEYVETDPDDDDYYNNDEAYQNNNFQYNGKQHDAYNDFDENEDSDELDDEPYDINHKNDSKEETQSFSSVNKLADDASTSEIKLKFTIDINNLKADMKKKSAKLLSKLSVSSNNCNLVRNLSKFDLEMNQCKTNESVVTSNHIIQELNEQTTLNDACLIVKENDSSTAPIETNIFNINNLKIKNKINIDFDFKSDDHLNEWLPHIHFIFDLNTYSHYSNEKQENEIVSAIERLQKSSHNAASNNKSESIQNLTNETNENKLKLPLDKTQVEQILSCNYEDKEDKKPIILASKKKAKVNTVDLACSGGIQQSLRNTDWSFNFSLDDSKKFESLTQTSPGPAILLQALTLSNAGDGFDLERLETVGDSFLKQAVTVYLFFMYPNVHEGKLSYLRSKQVSNYNLYKLGKRRGLPELLITSKFEPLDSWLPPHYESYSSVKTSTSTSLLLSALFASSNPKNNKPKAKSTQITTQEAQAQLTNQLSNFDKYKDHVVSDKSIADSVEAIIGAYLIVSGPQAALQVMSWFGLKVLPKAIAKDGSEILINIPEVPPPKINDPIKLEQLLEGYASFEAMIGYKFKQPAYLLQAFTHASYTDNTITDCYQRLEFLGDAILDYVITRHLYEDKKRHSPGELTDLRSSLVNNNIFAYLAVKYEFYKYFKYFSPALFPIIDNFVQNQKNRNDEFDLEEDFYDYPIDDDEDENGFLLGNDDALPSDLIMDKNELDIMDNQHHSYANFQKLNELEEMEVPKCLGDIFESVAGAIFLDSDKSFDTVWKVYYGLMKPHIDKFTAQVPKSPIRELFELEPETVKFEKPERTIDGKIRVAVSVFGRGKFKGVGRNYRIAKNAAAKLALKFLKNQKNEIDINDADI